MADTPDSIDAKLLIQLPGREPVAIGAINIPLTYGAGPVDTRATVDHDALQAAINHDIDTKVLRTPGTANS
jgi:hypothetical protein